MTSTNDWTLYYWGIKGRGHFVRLLFLEKGVKYTEVNDPKEMVPLMYCKAIPKENKTTFPLFAPPIVKHGNFYVSQTPVVCRYVATKLGLLPEKEQDQFHGEVLIANLGDIYSELSSNMKKEQKEFEKWCESRLQTWLQLLSNALGKNKFFFGDKCSYVDLFYYISMTESLKLLLGGRYDQYVTKKFPNLENLRVSIGKRESVQKLDKLGKNPYGEPYKWKN